MSLSEETFSVYVEPSIKDVREEYWFLLGKENYSLIFRIMMKLFE